MNALILDTSPARLALDRADAAYTLAVSAASRTGNWTDVQAARDAVHQARAALTQTEQEQA